MFDRFSAYQPQLLSLLRIVTGLLFITHGTAKVLAETGGERLDSYAPDSFKYAISARELTPA